MIDLLPQGCVIHSLDVDNKKQLLQEIAKRAAQATGLPERGIFDVLLERERLGTTGVGRGIAIPHGRIAGLDKVVGVFARMARVVDYNAIDERPVDLVFMLLAPTAAGSDHLKALARVSRLLREQGFCKALRGARNEKEIYNLFAATIETETAA